MKMWPFAIGAAAVLIVQIPNLSRSVAFARCATSVPGTIESSAGGEVIVTAEVNGRPVRFAEDFETLAPGQTVTAYSCGAGSSLHSLRPPQQHLFRALRLLVLGVAIFGPVVALLVGFRERLMSRYRPAQTTAE